MKLNTLPPTNFCDFYSYTMENVPTTLPSFVRLRLVDFLDWVSQNLDFPLNCVTIFLPLLIGILLGVAFLTVLERKVMGSIQRRMGPNVIGFVGLFQAIADGLKLAVKEPIIPRKANKFIFIGAPLFVFFVSLLGWFVIPLGPSTQSDFQLGLLYVLVINALEVYGVLLAGWASNSKYALLGGLRAAAQMISYELCISFIFLTIVLVSGTFNLSKIVLAQQNMWFILPLFPLGVLFFIAMLAETNRTPFDLPEAEAELVAGYNVEYSGLLFALFFLGEYANILFLSVLYVLLFFGGWTLGSWGVSNSLAAGLILFIKVVVIAFCFIWVRATLPRYRYDQLMLLGWKCFLPFSFCFFVGYLILSYATGTLPSSSDVFPYDIWPILL